MQQHEGRAPTPWTEAGKVLLPHDEMGGRSLSKKPAVDIHVLLIIIVWQVSTAFLALMEDLCTVGI